MSLTVTLANDAFSGPLDLLLHLIRRDEMDIRDIPIATLAAAYLDELRRLDMVNVDEGAEFLDLASRLLEIKSRMLLPPEEAEDGAEDEDDFDPRAGLVEALLEYRRFKDAARLLDEMAETQARRFPRVAPPMNSPGPDPEREAADCLDLLGAFQSMLLKMVPAGDSTVITYTEVPTSVRIEQIKTVLADIGSTRFSLLLSGAPSRREMVGFFIAMLEMIRQGTITARQSDNFSDIIIERREPLPERQAGGSRFARPRPRAGLFPRPRLRPDRETGPAGRPFPRPAPSRRGMKKAAGAKSAGRAGLFAPVPSRRPAGRSGGTAPAKRRKP